METLGISDSLSAGLLLKFGWNEASILDKYANDLTIKLFNYEVGSSKAPRPDLCPCCYDVPT